MSALKNLGLAICGLLLSFFLVSTIMFFSIAQITSYETLRPIATSVAEKGLTENMSSEEANAIYSGLVSYCETSGNQSVALPVGQEIKEIPIECSKLKNTTAEKINELFPMPVALTPTESELLYKNLINQCNATGNETVYFKAETSQLSNLTVNCSDIKNTKPEEIGKLVGGVIFDKLYFTDPGCEYPECFFKPKYGLQYFTVFLSSKAHDFYNKMFYISLALTIITAIGMIILGGKWTTIAKSFGIILIITGLPVFGLELLKSNLPQEIAGLIGSTAETIFKQLSNNFLYIFVIGIILLIIGFVGEKFSKKDKE